MDKKMLHYKIVRWAQKQNRPTANEGKPYHSRSYHREFEGYAEREYLDKRGRTRIERIYVGQYYQLDSSDTGRRFLKITHMALWLCMLLFFLLGATVDSGSNRAWYVVVFEAVDIVLLFRLALKVLGMPGVPKRMEIRQYRRVTSELVLDTGITVVSFGITAVGCLLYLLTHLDSASVSDELWTMCFYVVCGFIAFFERYVEKKQKYIVIPNQTELTEDITIIE